MKKHAFLLTTFIAAIIGISGCGNASQMTTDELFYTGMTPGVDCYRIPALVTAVNGDLIAAIDERVPNSGDLRKNRDINIKVRRSTDCGKTWSKLITVVDFEEGRSASDPSMIVDRSTGEIILFYNYMDLDKEPDIYYLHCVKSKDNGRTWSKPEWQKDFKFITSGRGMYTRDGKGQGCRHIHLTRDQGKT